MRDLHPAVASSSPCSTSKAIVIRPSRLPIGLRASWDGLGPFGQIRMVTLRTLCFVDISNSGSIVSAGEAGSAPDLIHERRSINSNGGSLTDRCPGCGLPLSRTRYLDEGRLKSCPECSRQHGRHAYHRLDAFGERRPAGGAPIMQSWCTGCRQMHGQPRQPERLC